jgi:hypothetical protein
MKKILNQSNIEGLNWKKKQKKNKQKNISSQPVLTCQIWIMRLG